MQLADLIDRLRERVRIRRLQIKPIFQDYDRKAVNKTISKFCHKVGCVTRAQFRQALGVIFPQVCSAQHSTAQRPREHACLLVARLTAALDSDSADLQVRFEEVHFEVLFGKLADGGDVNYLLFCSLVDPEVSARTAWRHALLRHAVACATAVPMNLVEAARLALPAHHRPISSACVLCWIDHMRHNMVCSHPLEVPSPQNRFVCARGMLFATTWFCSPETRCPRSKRRSSIRRSNLASQRRAHE